MSNLDTWSVKDESEVVEPPLTKDLGEGKEWTGGGARSVTDGTPGAAEGEMSATARASKANIQLSERRLTVRPVHFDGFENLR